MGRALGYMGRALGCWLGWGLMALALLAMPQGAGAQGVDAGQALAPQAAALGGRGGTLTLRQPARLAANFTLAPGQNLVLAAPLTVGAATIRLDGHNQVRCTAPVTLENGENLFVADGATDVGISGCTVHVAGRPGGYLLEATRAARISLVGNHLTDLALFTTQGGPGAQTTDVNITGNSTVFPKGGGPIGVYLIFVLRGTVNGNSFAGTGHGVEWWGGDANQSWPGFDKVTGTGQFTISGNQCHNAGGACVWGSDGADITVSDNSAEGCGDVCFDTEGGVRTRFTGNSARACGNGCYAAEFESQDVVFTGNKAYADNQAKAVSLVLIKHPSGRVPNHVNLQITDNTLSCGELCTAFYSEGEDGLTLSGNTVTNGLFVFINYTNNVSIVNNSLRFTLPVGNIVAITGPSMVNGHHSVISGNQIVAQAATGTNSSCIAQGWSDYNSTDEMQITNNFCSGFGRGVVTATGGGNPGAPHAVWTVVGNRFQNVPAAQQLVHQHTSGNEVYTAY